MRTGDGRQPGQAQNLRNRRRDEGVRNRCSDSERAASAAFEVQIYAGDVYGDDDNMCGRTRVSRAGRDRRDGKSYLSSAAELSRARKTDHARSQAVSVAPDEDRVALAHDELAPAVRERGRLEVLARLAGDGDGLRTGRVGDGDGADGVVELLASQSGTAWVDALGHHARSRPRRAVVLSAACRPAPAPTPSPRSAGARRTAPPRPSRASRVRPSTTARRLADADRPDASARSGLRT